MTVTNGNILLDNKFDEYCNNRNIIFHSIYEYVFVVVVGSVFFFFFFVYFSIINNYKLFTVGIYYVSFVSHFPMMMICFCVINYFINNLIIIISVVFRLQDYFSKYSIMCLGVFVTIAIKATIIITSVHRGSMMIVHVIML